MAAAASDGFHQILNIKISVTFMLILRVKYGWKGHAPSSFFAACINWRNFVLNLVMNLFLRCVNIIHFITGMNFLRFAMQKAAFTFAKQCRISTKAVLVSGYDGCLKRRKTTNLQMSIFQIFMMPQVQMLSKYIDIN